MNSKIIINSSVAFIVASLLEMTLHEAGHFSAAFLLGYHPVLHHNYVAYGEIPQRDHIITAMAGPLVSLCIGILFHILLNAGKLRGMNALVALYFSIFGYIGFLGYVMIAPFFSYGDTGYVLNALGCPMWMMVVLALIAVIVFYFLSKTWAIHFIGLMNKQTATDFQQRKRFIYSVVLFPLFIGIAITTLLNLPVPTTLSLIAPLTSPYVILWAFGAYLRKEGNYFDEKQQIASKIYVNWIFIFLVVVIVNRLLVAGFQA